MTKDNYLLDQIRHKFSYRLQGSERMKKIVCQTLAVFPPEIVNHVTNKCWFVSSFDDAWAFALRGDELHSDEHLIFLSDELLGEPVSEVQWTIAHEIGHVILEHRNAIMARQTKAQIARQEREADEFARKYFKNPSAYR